MAYNHIGDYMKTIILTGGGTAGHVQPNLALVPELKKAGYDVAYVGQSGGIEQRLVEEAGLPFYGIAAGKLRRYLSLRNLTDIGRTLKGISQAKKILRLLRPSVVFSKGGFVTVPVTLAARMRGVPVVIHESDLTPGLANRLAAPFAKTVCTSWPETPLSRKSVYTSAPIRAELLAGDREKGLKFLGFSGSKPVLLVMGGSTGAASVNALIREIKGELVKSFDVSHICGKGLVDETAKAAGYRQLEYVGGELADVYAATDFCVSRSGAGAVFELTALSIPALFVPLPKSVSRGDQILNAASAKKRGLCAVVDEAGLSSGGLLDAINGAWARRDEMKGCLSASKADQSAVIQKILLEIGKVERA